MPGEVIEVEVAVIGGGPGGYAAAFRAADLGKSVALVDHEPHLGGVCLLRGCIPSKAMISAGETLDHIRHAGVMGISTGAVRLDMARLAEWRDGIIRNLTRGVETLAEQRGVRWVRGAAKFQSHTSLHLDDSDASGVRFEQAIIASGSRAVFPPGLQPDGDRIIGSRGALALTELPGSMLVVGGGYIGVELGTAYAALGSKVTMVELTPNLLPGTDRDLVQVVRKSLDARGVAVHLETTVERARRTEAGVEVSLRPRAGEAWIETFDYVLVAVGRAPNTGGLNLQGIGVDLDDKQFIRVDRQCRTNVPNIYAIGDCAGQPMLAHKAQRQGVVAAEVIGGQAAAFDNVTVPAVIFAHPEIASCGMSEEEARAAGYEPKVGRFSFRASGRAMSLNQTDGFIKVIADAATEMVLGVRMVGPNVSELIAEATLAVEMGAVLEDLIATIHVHPTLAEVFHEAAEGVRGAAIHLFRGKREKQPAGV